MAEAQEALDTVITERDTQLQTLEEAMATVLRDGAWAESATLLASIPGIGLVTTAWLLVGTLNFTACASAEAAAAYAGLVPLARESGTSVRGRAQIGHSRHARLRTARYMAPLTAARFHPLIRTQDERLRAAGKPPKGARCAAARTLIHLAFAVVTKKRPFDPAYRVRDQHATMDAAAEVAPAGSETSTGCERSTPPWYSRSRLLSRLHRDGLGVGRSHPVAEGAPQFSLKLALDKHYRI